MPRKRVTKARTAKVSKPTEDVSQILTEKEENEKSEQLELMLKEFDCQVDTYIKKFEKQRRALDVTFNQRYNNFLQKIGPELQSMTIKEFVEAGGTFESATASLKGKSSFKSIDNKTKVTELKNLLCTGPPRMLDRVIEEDCDGADQKENIDLKQELTSLRKKRAPKKFQPPPSTARRSKRAISGATPVSFGKDYWGQTPLITPKFNPNLPTTPDNIRKRKPGERLIVMSIDGSPVECSFTKDEKKQNPAVGPTLADYDLTPTRMEEILRLFAGSSQLGK